MLIPRVFKSSQLEAILDFVHCNRPAHAGMRSLKQVWPACHRIGSQKFSWALQRFVDLPYLWLTSEDNRTVQHYDKANSQHGGSAHTC